MEVVIWSKLAFLRRANLDQIITSNLDQIITSKNVLFFVFVALKNLLTYLFLQCFWKSRNNWQKNAPKQTITFHTLQKKTFCCTPFVKKLCFLNLHLSKKKHWCWTKNKTSGKKTKIGKGNLKEKRREETNKNEKGLMNENFVIEYFDVVLFMKQKQRRKKKEKEAKTRNKKKAKQKKKAGWKKRKRERQRKRKWKRGRPKKASEKEREH